MNDKELDRLFRQKLDPMEVTPSAEAWQQLEAGLQHKKEKKIWAHISRVAAVVLLLLGSWGAFEYSRQLAPVEQMAKNETKPDLETTSLPLQEEVAQSKTSQEVVTPKQITIPTEAPAKAVAFTEAPAEKAEPGKKYPPAPLEEQQLAFASTEKQEQENITATVPVSVVNNKSLQAPALAANIAQITVDEPIALKEEVVIRYYADEEPATNAAVAAIEPTPEKNKETSARKIFGFLKKVTDNSGNSLAELREAKNELLSLNRLAQSGSGRPE
jgi:hypothetical protein